MEHRQTLIRVLTECVERAEHAPMSLGEALDSLKNSAYGLSAVLLCLPFLQPLTLGPLSSAGGLVLASLGWQLMRGREVMWLPQRIYQVKPSTKLWERLLGLCTWLLKVLAKITRERLTSWVDGRFGERMCGGLIAIGGALLVIPAPILPFNNTSASAGDAVRRDRDSRAGWLDGSGQCVLPAGDRRLFRRFFLRFVFLGR